MDRTEILAALATAGLIVTETELHLQRREGRIQAKLPDGRMAWFPLDDDGQDGMARERRILRLLEDRCAFLAPRVLAVGEDGWDLRQPVPGVCDAGSLYDRLRGDHGLAARLGADIGHILAEQHGKIGAADLDGWLRPEVAWPEPDAWIAERLPRVIQDAGLLKRIAEGLARYRAQAVAPGDRVLAHCDLGLHNFALDPANDRVAGVFDYEGAAFADRHHDFKYLIFPGGHEAMLEGAIAAYEPLTGVRLDRPRIRLYNAACAIGFLANRAGHGAEESWCGRTLAEDLAWTDEALSALGI
jgi:hypothetical protein